MQDGLWKGAAYIAVDRAESATVPVTNAVSKPAHMGSANCAFRIESGSGKDDFMNSFWTVSRRRAEVEGEAGPVGATALTTEAPVGLRTSASAPKTADVDESEPKTAAVMEAATCRWVRSGSPPVRWE